MRASLRVQVDAARGPTAAVEKQDSAMWRNHGDFRAGVVGNAAGVAARRAFLDGYFG